MVSPKDEKRVTKRIALNPGAQASARMHPFPEQASTGRTPSMLLPTSWAPFRCSLEHS